MPNQSKKYTRITIKLSEDQLSTLRTLVHPTAFKRELALIIDRGMRTKPENPVDTDSSTVYQRYQDEETARLLAQLDPPDLHQEGQATMSTPTALYLYASLDADTNLHIIFNALTAQGAITEFQQLKADPDLADYEQFTYDPYRVQAISRFAI